MIEVTQIENIASLKEISDDWKGLCSVRGEHSTVFCTPEWYECWWKHFRSTASLKILVAREGENIIGVAPMMLQKKWFRGLPVRVLSFPANGNSLHNDFILTPGKEAEALTALIDHVFNHLGSWDLLDLANMSVEDSSYRYLTSVLIAHGHLWKEKEGMHSPYIPISSDWDTYFRQRTTRTRKTLRQICNSIDRAGPWKVLRIKSRDEYLEVRDAVYDVARRSWSEAKGDSLASHGNELFFEDLSLVSSRHGWLNLWILQLNEEVIAFEYHLQYGARIHGLRSSYAEEHASLSPGAFLNYQVIKHLFEADDGIEEYDLGGSFDPYKKKWSNQARTHANIQVFQKGPYSRLLCWLEYRVMNGLRRVRNYLKRYRLGHAV